MWKSSKGNQQLSQLFYSGGTSYLIHKRDYKVFIIDSQFVKKYPIYGIRKVLVREG